MPRIGSFDYLRLFAMSLVTIQHILSVLGYYGKTSWLGVSIGQAGVAIFCALSGYLAFQTRLSNPWPWFKRRLEQLFPAYWLVTILSFVLTLLAGTKQITWLLFISQMLGMGYFTHGWELVNVVSWFISLILLCYTIRAVAALFQRAKLVLLIVACVCSGLVITRAEVDLSRHILVFTLAGLVAYTGMPIKKIILTAVIGLIASSLVSLQFAYAALSLIVLAVSLSWKMPEHVYVRQVSVYTYEFFLVHGVFLVAFTHFMPDTPIVSVVCALGASSIAAVMLHKTVKRIYGAVATCLWPKTSNV